MTSSALVWNSGSAANTVLPGRSRSAQAIIQAFGDLVGVRARGELGRAGRAAGVQVARDVAGARRRPGQRRRRPRRPSARRGRRPSVAPSGSSAGGCALRRGRVAAPAAPARRSRAATARACSHTAGSSSGPEATITRAPARRTSSVACSAASAGLIGAKMPTASAASSSGSSSAQLTEMTATASPRATPSSPSTFAARWTSAASSRERAAHRRLPVLGVGQHRRRRCGRARARRRASRARTCWPAARDRRAGRARPRRGRRGRRGEATAAAPMVASTLVTGSLHGREGSAAAGVRSGRIAHAGRPGCGVAIGKPVRRKRGGGGPPHWLIVRGADRPVARLVAVGSSGRARSSTRSSRRPRRGGRGSGCCRGRGGAGPRCTCGRARP